MAPSRGVLYMIASAFAFSVMSLLVKLASARLPTGQIVLARAVVTLVVSLLMVARLARRTGVARWGTRKAGLVLRGVLGFGGLTFYYLSLAHLPLADATTIQNTTPLLTALLAWWLLREPVGWTTAIALVCGIAGVTLIVHPSGAGVDPVGVGAALAGTVCASFAYVTVRQLARTEHPLVIVLYFPIVATPLALPWALVTWVPPTATEWGLLLAIGLATQLGQVFLTMALVIERAARAMSVGYVQVAFAMAWQWMVFAHAPTAWTLGGAALIVAGTLVVTRADVRADVRADARAAAAGSPSSSPS